MKSGYRNQRLSQLSFFICILSFVILLSGCDAFVRKFTRKPKKENLSREEMVLAPEEYKPSMNKEEQYRQYFLFWQSWHDELLESLAQSRSQKKQITCAEEAIKNLSGLRGLLNEEKQKRLDVYISQLIELQMLIAKDAYSSGASEYILSAETLKRALLREFSYPKVKKSLI